MELQYVTFAGPGVDDVEILERLPKSLGGLLRQLNGFVQYHGGLHVRGACLAPEWHSLRAAWEGPQSYAALYRTVLACDIPFAEDCVGDQFLLRDGVVWRLACETDELESLGVSLREFFEAAQADPVAYLGLHPLHRFIKEHNAGLEPGQLLSAYPPFCFKEAAEGVQLAAVPAMERRAFLADLASQLKSLPEGVKINFAIVE